MYVKFADIYMNLMNCRKTLYVQYANTVQPILKKFNKQKEPYHSELIRLYIMNNAEQYNPKIQQQLT